MSCPRVEDDQSTRGDVMSDMTPTNNPSTGEKHDQDDAAASDPATTTGDPTATDHPTGEDQAAQNEENELPG
jgi:hypothetical protein